MQSNQKIKRQFISSNLKWSPLKRRRHRHRQYGPSSSATRLTSISVSTSGCEGSAGIFCPSGEDFHGKHSEPLGMSNSYLVVVSDEGLPGSDCGSAVHFQVGVVIFPYEHLQDVQHLQGREERKSSGTFREGRRGEKLWEEKRGWGWIISKRIRAD